MGEIPIEPIPPALLDAVLDAAPKAKAGGGKNGQHRPPGERPAAVPFNEAVAAFQKTYHEGTRTDAANTLIGFLNNQERRCQDCVENDLLAYQTIHFDPPQDPPELLNKNITGPTLRAPDR